MSEGETKNGNAVEVSSVKTVKLPSFRKNHPLMWFKQVEKALANITDDITKFQHVVLNLDEETLNLVEDIVKEPPEKGKYEALKERIIEANITQVCCYLNMRTIGKRVDSNYLSYVRTLLDRYFDKNKIHDYIVREEIYHKVIKRHVCHRLNEKPIFTEKMIKRINELNDINRGIVRVKRWYKPWTTEIVCLNGHDLSSSHDLSPYRHKVSNWWKLPAIGIASMGAVIIGRYFISKAFSSIPSP